MTAPARSFNPPGRLALAGGGQLAAPRATPVRSLRCGDWIAAAGGAGRIADLRARPDGGRIVHLEDGPPLSLGVHEPVYVYLLLPPR